MDTARLIYIVDDDAIIRKSLNIVIQEAGFSCRSFASGEDFLEALSYLPIGCVLLDVHMPGISGLDLQPHIRATRPDLALILMTAAGNVAMAVQAIKGGARHFIEKPFTDQQLFDQLAEVFQEMSVERDHASSAANALDRIAPLSARERQVLAGLVNGLPNKVIAFELGLGVRTVETHRANMMRKLNAHSVSEVVQIALEAGLEPLAFRAA